MKLTAVFGLILISLNACNQQETGAKHENSKWWSEDDRRLIIAELTRTTEAVVNEIVDISNDQWNFKEDSTRWSIGEIVEHLEMQNQLHYRELSVMSRAPENLTFRHITDGRDEYFIKYSSDPQKGKAQWFLEPRGRYCDPESGHLAFIKARNEMIKFVQDTEIDLRKRVTYRVSVETNKALEIGQVRDLHQLLLTGIAHTDRHLNQIRQIKLHPSFPNN